MTCARLPLPAPNARRHRRPERLRNLTACLSAVGRMQLLDCAASLPLPTSTLLSSASLRRNLHHPRVLLRHQLPPPFTLYEHHQTSDPAADVSTAHLSLPLAAAGYYSGIPVHPHVLHVCRDGHQLEAVGAERLDVLPLRARDADGIREGKIISEQPLNGKPCPCALTPPLSAAGLTSLPAQPHCGLAPCLLPARRTTGMWRQSGSKV